jgi:hypothetical protein
VEKKLTIQNCGMFISFLSLEHLLEPWRCEQHRWASTSTSISAISDIRHQHLLLRYRKKICRTENCHSDIGRVPISTSESIPISDIQEIFITSAGFEPKTLVISATVLIYEFLDVGYQISDKSFPISDIMSDSALFSPISEVPISSSVRYRWSRISE